MALRRRPRLSAVNLCSGFRPAGEKDRCQGLCPRGSTYQHKELAAGRWKSLGFLEQMANIGSEVERALNWRAKNNPDYSQKAFERALELVDLTLDSAVGYSRLKELTRLREALVDYFLGENQFGSTQELWKKYFWYFAYAARKR